MRERPCLDDKLAPLRAQHSAPFKVGAADLTSGGRCGIAEWAAGVMGEFITEWAAAAAGAGAVNGAVPSLHRSAPSPRAALDDFVWATRMRHIAVCAGVEGGGGGSVLRCEWRLTPAGGQTSGVLRLLGRPHRGRT